MDILNELFNFLTQNAGVKLFTQTGIAIKSIAPLFSMGFAIYILLLSFYYYNKGIDESIVDLSKKMLGWLLLIALAFNATNYAALAKMLYDLPDSMIGWYSGSKLTPNLFSNAYENIAKIVKAILVLTKGMGLTDFAMKALAGISILIVVLCGVILVAFSFFYYLIAKLCLALVLMVGPFYIGFALFPATRQYAMNWVGQILNYSFTCLLYAVISMLQMSFVTEKLNGWGTGKIANTGVLINIILTMIPITVLFVMLVWSVPSIASALTGGAGVDLHGRTLGRALGMGKKGFDKITSGGRSGGSMRNGK